MLALTGAFVAAGDSVDRKWLVVERAAGVPMKDTASFKAARENKKCLDFMKDVRDLVKHINQVIWDASGVNHMDLNVGNIMFADDLSTAAFFDWGNAIIDQVRSFG